MGMWNLLMGGGASGSPTTPTDYPLPGGSYQVFEADLPTGAWPGQPPALPLNDANTTFTLPGDATDYIRVIVCGGNNNTQNSEPGSGAGAIVDALIPVTPGSGDRYKAIVAGYANPNGTGGPGVGAGPGRDSNDQGTGGGGSAFFYAEPGASSDPAMFPNGVLIAGGGGGGGTAVPAGGGPQSSDPIGGFTGIFREGSGNANSGEPGKVGGVGGRLYRSPATSLEGSNAARGSGGTYAPDGHGGAYGGGSGGGAGGGGYGGAQGDPGTNAEGSPSGRGYGYGDYNNAGAGRGGEYPMRGGNGFTYNGVDLGGGGGGSHGKASGGGGWGGGGGAYYDKDGGAGGSGAWGYEPGTATITPWVPSASVTINGGNLSSVCSVDTAAGQGGGAKGGYVVILW